MQIRVPANSLKESVFEKIAFIDPAPPSEKSHSVDELKEFLLNSENSLWDRYRAMFRLRNINTEEAVQALAEGGQVLGIFLT